MDFITASEPLVRYAVVAGVATFALSALLLLRILHMHGQRLRREMREARLVELWGAVLGDWASGIKTKPPELPTSDVASFLHLWNEAHEAVRGAARERLDRLAVRIALAPMVVRLLHSEELASRMWAALTLGNLRHRPAWDELWRLAHTPSPWMSFTAARALTRIAPAEAMAELMPYFVQRNDWSRSRLLLVLRDAGPPAVSPPLARAIETAPESELPRLLSFSSAADPALLRPAILQRLERTQDPQVLAACLRHHRDARDLPRLRQLIEHPAWIVRVQAARALGALGRAEDVGRLIKHLDDDAWWVSFRAAQALAESGLVPRDDLRRLLQRAQLSPQGRTMLEFVLNEPGAAAA